jgi:pimeloyl-ACP methyl ester carboxylesterase
MAQLSQHHDVIVPEHPGFGESDTPDWLDRTGDLALFYLDFFKHLGLNNVHLVGSSLGGWIAAELAVRNDTNLSSLTLVAPAGVRVKGSPMADIFLWSPEKMARNLVHDPELAARMMPGDMTQEQQMLVLKNRLTTARLAWQPRLHNPDLRKWLHRVSVPTQILWGSEDQLIPAAYAQAWCDLIPGSQSTVFPSCGHLPHVEMTDLYCKTLTQFIREVAP